MSNYYNDQWRLPNNENKDKQSNYSMSFDGSQNIDCGNISALNGATQATWSCWYKKTANGAVYFMGTWGGSSARLFLPYQFSQGAGAIMYVYMGSSTGSSRLMFQNATNCVINLNTWYHMAFVYNESESSNSDKLKFYLDATELPNETTGFALTSLNTVTASFNIGAPLTPSLTGKLDGVAIFDYALTDGTGGTVNQIAALYGSSSTGIGNPQSITPNPVAWYNLGDQDAFNGAEYLVPNSSLKDYVFDFDPSGSGDYISFGNQSAFQPTSNYTFSVWFKYNSSSSVGIFSTNSSVSSVGGVLAYITGTSILYYHSSSVLSISNIPSTNEWINLTVTWSASTGVVRSFINGKYKSQLTGKTSMTWGNDLIVGKYKDSSMYFDGELSNFVMWDATLTDGFSGTPTAGDVAGGQVAEVYNNGSPQTTVTGTPVGWWKLDASATYDGTDWTIPDDSSNSNDGTSLGMTQSALQQSDLSFTSGYSPYALDFDGTDDTVQFSSLSDFQGESLTVSFWIKASVNGSNTYATMRNDTFFIYQKSSETYLRYRIKAPSFYTIDGGTTLDNNWHHCLITFNDSTNEFKVFEDGSQVGSTVITTGSLLSDTSSIYLGSYNGSSSFKSGNFSNVSIWNTSLTSAQVSELYNEGVPSNLNNHSAYSNLVSWWQLGSNTSWVDPYWIALDEKGTNNGESQNVAAPNNMGENAIVNGVGSYANGVGTSGLEVIGSAPFSDANSLSVNMDVLDRTDDTPA